MELAMSPAQMGWVGMLYGLPRNVQSQYQLCWTGVPLARPPVRHRKGKPQAWRFQKPSPTVHCGAVSRIIARHAPYGMLERALSVISGAGGAPKGGSPNCTM